MIYIGGFIAPVNAGTTCEAYVALAEKAAPILKEYGALRVVEG
ncbi:DUF1428 family protein [Sphingomonas sp. PB2P19]